MQPVVELREIEPGIALITMQDRVYKNTFSDDLVKGLAHAFLTVKETERYKAVILTGYDTYFASGGTQEALLAIFEGQLKFTDSNFYSLALECPVPVISAMQGHAIGGGFVIGMFADFVVMSRESVYTANFMKYGFTPGMGATYILPRKLGLSLGNEMLLSSSNYRGADLEKRGVPFAVLPRDQVMSHALELARQLAEKPRLSLVTLKDHLVETMRAELPNYIAKEVAMHELTFHQTEVRDKILSLFGK
ncbi:polyketide synthase [Brevibacillus fortis]|uniref:Enoyl-CoA hydratase n=1 Tax=Brevibacillus brevis TaxID=1393 RepID=A0A517IF58_BREBE|nr:MULTISPECIES: polyketide synthase [Brevibacillus]MED1780912.1 polyketide synthase [Brevibacillus fortis]MED1917318.1 polyketide synthase [Bacillus thuringiensis]QDS37507.1 enoyl-CoA hydratase [Brevibacillus brevis]